MKDAVVFEITMCIKTCERQQRSWLITTNNLECCKFSYLLYLSHWHFTMLPYSFAALATLLARAIEPRSSKIPWIGKTILDGEITQIEQDTGL